MPLLKNVLLVKAHFVAKTRIRLMAQGMNIKTGELGRSLHSITGS